jgi:hypothetical protein
MLNPKYHVMRLREDLGHMMKAIALRKTLNFEDHEVSLGEVFRGKLLSTFFLTGPSGLVALGLAYWVQRITANAFVGFFMTVLFLGVITSAFYQLLWYLDNRRIYRQAFGDPISRFLNLQRDILPVNFKGIRTGLVLGAVSTFWLASLIIAPIQIFFPRVAEVVPAGLLLFGLEAIFVQAPLLRIMGDFFEKHGQVLGEKYRPALTGGS